jgi:hypothetical protein
MKSILSCVCLLAAAAIPLCADDWNWTNIYMRSSAAPPWGVTSNETDMNDVFGAGNWNTLNYESANPSWLFTPSTSFIYMEGGDNNASALQTFLSNNGDALAAWVNAGGRLFINAAPNQGGNINFGFGITLNFSTDYTTSSNNAVTVGNSSIFNGPMRPVGTAFTGGDSFSHGYLTGSGFTPLLQDDQGRTVLAQMAVGSGLVIAGGLTVDIFQAPWPQTHYLRMNIIYYTASAQLN